MMDEEESPEEDDFDIEGEIDPVSSPPWDAYDIDIDMDDDITEDTALLHTKSRTEIIVTPVSPVCLKIIFIMDHGLIIKLNVICR